MVQRACWATAPRDILNKGTPCASVKATYKIRRHAAEPKYNNPYLHVVGCPGPYTDMKEGATKPGRMRCLREGKTYF